MDEKSFTISSVKPYFKGENNTSGGHVGRIRFKKFGCNRGTGMERVG